MTARTTYATTVAAAESTKVAALTVAESARQETINVSGCNVGYNLQTGSYPAFAAAVKSANAAKFAALTAAEQAKQNTLMAARDTLKATGDLGPV
jgi:hypothetical protein